MKAYKSLHLYKYFESGFVVKVGTKVVNGFYILVGKVLAKMTEKLSNADPLFKSLYQRPYYGGSFYDGLKVGHPDEFDIDLLLCLPKLITKTLMPGDQHGFMKLRLNQLEGFPDIEKKLVSAGYLDNFKVRCWMEGLIAKVLNESSSFRVYNNGDLLYATISSRKSGPAFTLKVEPSYTKSIEINIDLVPCFILTTWPDEKFSYKPNPTNRDSFFLVPKSLDNASPYYGHDWRVSFPEQEKDLINDRNRLKPTIKLIKKIRDKYNHDPITSYFIKTVALWELEKMEREFWNFSLSYVFMTILKRYQDYLSANNIPFYWKNDYNLLQLKKPDTITNFKNCFGKIITKIETNYKNNPEVVLEFLLTDEELSDYYNNGADLALSEGEQSDYIRIRDDDLAQSDSSVTDEEQSDYSRTRDDAGDLAQPDNIGIGAVLVGLGALAVGGLFAYRALARQNRRE